MKNGFTMIELIFVIVVLGILAAVAIPKFTNISSEALVSSEKAMIGSIRSSIGMIKGKAQIKRSNFVMTMTGVNGSKETVFMEVSKGLYPLSLSTEIAKSTVSKVATNNPLILYPNDITTASFNTDYVLTASASGGNSNELYGNQSFQCSTSEVKDCYHTGSIVLEQDSRLKMRTSAVKDGKQYIEGVASDRLGPDNATEDSELEIDYKGAWVYDSSTGIINYHSAYSDGSEIEYKFINLNNL